MLSKFNLTSLTRVETTLPLPVPNLKISRMIYWPGQGQMQTPRSQGKILEDIGNMNEAEGKAIVIRNKYGMCYMIKQ